MLTKRYMVPHISCNIFLWCFYAISPLTVFFHFRYPLVDVSNSFALIFLSMLDNDFPHLQLFTVSMNTSSGSGTIVVHESMWFLYHWSCSIFCITHPIVHSWLYEISFACDLMCSMDFSMYHLRLYIGGKSWRFNCLSFSCSFCIFHIFYYAFRNSSGIIFVRCDRLFFFVHCLVDLA